MTAEERLNRVVLGKYEYQRLLLRVEEIKTMCERITPVLSDMPKGPHDNNNTGDMWIKLMDSKTECEERIEQYLKDYEALDQELECIRSDKIRAAMKYRYLHGMSLKDIADTMIYSDRAIRKFLTSGRKIYVDKFGDE